MKSGIVMYRESNKAYEEYENGAGERIRVVNISLCFKILAHMVSLPPCMLSAKTFLRVAYWVEMQHLMGICGIEQSDAYKNVFEKAEGEPIYELNKDDLGFILEASDNPFFMTHKILAEHVWPKALMIQERRNWGIDINLSGFKYSCRIGATVIENCYWVNTNIDGQ